ncbi:MAG: phospho-N-acetylmuramoyl-pentapeptide-transferase [Candidatus Buchananbacteria bacterium CG10_big_fil_rev_8_21_14_0_10_42_9]|uniref:Phospho-N-acetylmuramoyl-pentapeptide-transferase n=1 Tax=Candidatus Buchananbacteria bacterium CG10_big_fil_rev_8_21_14_0_10_42_9 TaxID=1974526 RepID=A0A2H0W2L8_9BACT|nr:MAG: phospho-N-acetylmuramoyl-pentapeptide-transferase [Candidatus Buchananbacteria bacterium CG10_big_fil_rev_8_21_14_0_10_42_9]
MDNFLVVKIFSLTTLAFVVAILWTPILTHYLYKYKLGKSIRNAPNAPIFYSLHAKKAGTPTMGGILIWVTVLVITGLVVFLDQFIGGVFTHLNYFSRSETLLPLGAMVAAALVGLADDLIDVRATRQERGGLRVRHRLLIYGLIALVGAYWFFFKLDWSIIHVPFFGNFEIGWWYIPFFIFVIVATGFSVNEIDGLDGLAGGTLLTAFAAYGAIAFVQERYDLATLCAVIVGALLAFLWFNINPARFFMGDTGSMSLGVTLGIIAMLTNAALLLPIIGLLFVAESGSVIIQLTSKKLLGKKIFRSTPIHHHFEAMGWPEPKIVMRFWVVSGVAAVAGLIIFLIDKL